MITMVADVPCMLLKGSKLLSELNHWCFSLESLPFHPSFPRGGHIDG
jgi:hypothetical protein